MEPIWETPLYKDLKGTGIQVADQECLVSFFAGFATGAGICDQM